MGKDCGRGNEGRKFLQSPGLRISFQMSQISAKGDIAHNYHKQTGLCNPRTAEYRGPIMNENSNILLKALFCT